MLIRFAQSALFVSGIFALASAFSPTATFASSPAKSIDATEIRKQIKSILPTKGGISCLDGATVTLSLKDNQVSVKHTSPKGQATEMEFLFTEMVTGYRLDRAYGHAMGFQAVFDSGMRLYLYVDAKGTLEKIDLLADEPSHWDKEFACNVKADE